MPPLIPIALALAQFAPSLLRFFGAGNASVAVAEKVVSVAQTMTGTKTPEEALQAIRENAQLQQQFNLAVLGMDKDLEIAYLGDRQDARKRDVALAQAGRRNVRADVMVAIDAVGLIVCLLVLCLYRKDLPGEAVALISTIAGFFGLGLRDAHQFEFGSSRGSKDKDDVTAAALQQLVAGAKK